MNPRSHKRPLTILLAGCALALAALPAIAPPKSGAGQLGLLALSALGVVVQRKFEPFAVKLQLADGTEADATVAPTDATATPAVPDAGAMESAIKAAVGPAVTAAVGPAVEAAVAPLLQRIATVEAAITADAAADATELPADAPAVAKAMRAIRKNFSALSTQLGDHGTKLARRFGLEFAARAGAAPLEHAAGGGDPKPHVYDQYQSAEGGEKTRLFRAHRSEILTEGRRRGAAV